MNRLVAVGLIGLIALLAACQRSQDKISARDWAILSGDSRYWNQEHIALISRSTGAIHLNALYTTTGNICKVSPRYMTVHPADDTSIDALQDVLDRKSVIRDATLSDEDMTVTVRELEPLYRMRHATGPLELILRNSFSLKVTGLHCVTAKVPDTSHT